MSLATKTLALIALFFASAFVGTASGDALPYHARAMASVGVELPVADRVLVRKSERRLYLMRGDDVLRAYREAREAGIREINMDLIVGLPGEGVAQMERTLAALAPLDMDNLTVHTLAIKHSSRLNERLADYPLPGDEEAARMLELCHAFARARGMEPYYMYRQKYMRGNLENVGYALPGAACVYNIDMMEETHHIVALGAGAVSKRMFYGENRHQRFPNPKSVEHYCANIDGLIERKIAFFRES